MFGLIQMKIDQLLKEQAIVNDKLKKWKLIQKEVNALENEISLLQKLKVSRKLHAYELFIQLGLIAQGLMHYLSVHHSELVWRHFGTWLRTIRSGIPASEKVVSSAMVQTYGEFIVDEQNECNFKKFLRQRIDFTQIKGCFLGERLAA